MRKATGFSLSVGHCFFAMALFLSPVLAQDGITGIFNVTLQGAGDNSLLIGQLEITDDSHEFGPDEKLFTNHF